MDLSPIKRSRNLIWPVKCSYILKWRSEIETTEIVYFEWKPPGVRQAKCQKEKGRKESIPRWKEGVVGRGGTWGSYRMDMILLYIEGPLLWCLVGLTFKFNLWLTKRLLFSFWCYHSRNPVLYKEVRSGGWIWNKSEALFRDQGVRHGFGKWWEI